MIHIFYDLETTGTDIRLHSIHQIAGLVVVDNAIVEEFNIKTRPHPKALYDSAALRIGRVTEAELKEYQPMKKAKEELIGILSKYINKFNPQDKAFLIGFNNRGFDDRFLIAWFEQMEDDFIASWFFFGLDVQALALEYLKKRRPKMTNFKLGTVARELGMEVDKSGLHDAYNDVRITYQIYRIVTGLDIEI